MLTVMLMLMVMVMVMVTTMVMMMVVLFSPPAVFNCLLFLSLSISWYLFEDCDLPTHLREYL